MARFRNLGLVLVLCAVLSQAGLSSAVLLSNLAKSLDVSYSIIHGANDQSEAANVAKAGEDSVKLSWSLKNGYSDRSYNKVSAKLCFAPISRQDRDWRKANNDLSKDKACSISVKTSNYSAGSITWLVSKDVPGAQYFVRIYALDSSGIQVVGYGESSNSTNFFVVVPITGRHASLDIATAVFSAFSVVSLLGLFATEKLRAKRARKN